MTTCDSEGNLNLFRCDSFDPRSRTPSWSKNRADRIRAVIHSYEVLVFHNADFDLTALGLIDPSLEQLCLSKTIHDTFLSSHVLNSDEPHGLKEQCLLHLDILDDDEQELEEKVKKYRPIAKKKGWRIAEKGDPHFPLQTQELFRCDYWLPYYLYEDKVCDRYALRDVERTIALRLLHEKQLPYQGLEEQYDREMRLLPVVRKMEKHGVSLLEPSLSREIRRYRKEAKECEARCVSLTHPEFNVRSGPQLQKLLYGNYQLPVIKKTASGNPSTDEDTLQKLYKQVSGTPRDFIESLLTFKKNNTATTYLSNYVRAAMRDAYHVLRLYPSFNQVGTATTRFSSSSPNAQNIGKGDEWEEEGEKVKDFLLRSVFGPRKGRVWYPIDYSQLQLRIFAFASQEESLIRAFEDGWDFHNFVASRIFKTDKPTELQRRVAKNVNFALIFGGGPAKVDATAGMVGAYDAFRGQFPSVDRYMASVIQFARKHGYVKTLGGYRLVIPSDKAYVGVNYIIQGTEGEIVKNAMISCDEYLGDFPPGNGVITLQVHDEIVFEFDRGDEFLPDVRKLAYLMESEGLRLGMVTPVDISRVKLRWSEKESIAA